MPHPEHSVKCALRGGRATHATMPNAHLLRNESPLPNVLKVRGPPRCMSAKTFKKQKATILPRLRARTDPPPRLMRPGTGAADQWHASLCALLERPDAVLVRGYRLYKLSVDLGHWGEPAWLALTHMVVATVSESGNVVYEDPTELGEEEEYVFVPSDRAHRDLSTEQLLSGRWLSGLRRGRPPALLPRLRHPASAWRTAASAASSPPRPRGSWPSPTSSCARCRTSWPVVQTASAASRERDGDAGGADGRAGLRRRAPTWASTDALAAYNAAVRQPRGVRRAAWLALKLELKCRQPADARRGQRSTTCATLFFALFDSCARLVRDGADAAAARAAGRARV